MGGRAGGGAGSGRGGGGGRDQYGLTKTQQKYAQSLASSAGISQSYASEIVNSQLNGKHGPRPVYQGKTSAQINKMFSDWGKKDAKQFQGEQSKRKMFGQDK